MNRSSTIKADSAVAAAAPASDFASASASPPSIHPGLVRLFAFSCAVIVANIYYAQPLIQLIAPDLGLPPASASAIISVTQAGFALGVFFLVPLGDMMESRRLILSAMSLATLGLIGVAVAQQPWTFLLACLVVGLCSVCAQMIIPLAAHMTPEAHRGRVVGKIMAGLTLGIMLSRPLASLLTDHFGWRAVFAAAACLMGVVLALAIAYLPHRQPSAAMKYGALIASLFHLMRESAVLRRRALYQGCLFFAFASFWSTVPVELAVRHGFSQSQIACFTLIAAAGVFGGPLGGRAADAGYTRAGTRLALGLAVLALLAGLTAPGISLLGIGITALLLDFAVQFNMVLGQRAIYTLAPELRSRLNAVYMTSLFIGAACGSAVTSALYAHGGWRAVAVAASIPPGLAALYSLRASSP